MIVAFVDDNRDELGIEPICRALQVAPSTYYAAKCRQVAPSARPRVAAMPPHEIDLAEASSGAGQSS